jgi:hypothetical protein
MNSYTFTVVVTIFSLFPSPLSIKMTRLVSLAVASLIVTTSFAQVHQINQFFKRAPPRPGDPGPVIDIYDCRGEGWENDLVSGLIHFVLLLTFSRWLDLLVFSLVTF